MVPTRVDDKRVITIVHVRIRLIVDVFVLLEKAHGASECQCVNRVHGEEGCQPRKIHRLELGARGCVLPLDQPEQLFQPTVDTLLEMFVITSRVAGGQLVPQIDMTRLINFAKDMRNVVVESGGFVPI